VPRRRRLLRERADAHTDHRKAVLVGVQAPKVLPARLADSIEAVRPDRRLRADALGCVVEAGDVQAAGNHNPRTALAAGRLEDVEGPSDVGLQDALEGVLVGNARQVNDPIDIGHGRTDRGQVANIGGDEFLTGVGGSERDAIEQAHCPKASLKPLAERLPDRAGCSGDQHPIHA
jgi:hypothetical protein